MFDIQVHPHPAIMKYTLILFALLLASLPATAAPTQHNIRPGQPWLDTNGELINAHGFCILHHEDTYYWYGAHKIPGKTEEEKNEAGVRCYVSKDLLNWRNAGFAAPGLASQGRSLAMPGPRQAPGSLMVRPVSRSRATPNTLLRSVASGVQSRAQPYGSPLDTGANAAMRSPNRLAARTVM